MGSAILPRMFRRALCLVVLTASAFAQSDGREPAPRFNAKSIAGQTYNNASLKGKIVLLQLWTTWCPYCRGEQPLVDQLTQEFAAKGLVVLAVDVGESKKKVKQYLQTSPRACPIVLNEDTNLPAMFATTQYPVYVVIDRDGNIAGIQRGAGGERALRQLLARGGMRAQEQAEE
jgi:thiol-disulfide isomerase/thioredoxin